MANLRDKNDRAIVAFLRDVVKGVDASANIYPSNYSGERDQQHGLVDIITEQGPEQPPGSANYLLNVKVRAQHPAASQPDQANQNANRIFIGELTDAVFDALHQQDNNQDYKATAVLITTAGNNLAVNSYAGSDPATIALAAQIAEDNEDMGDYTCMNLYHNTILGAPDEGEKSISFVEIIRFQVYAAALGGLN